MVGRGYLMCLVVALCGTGLGCDPGPGQHTSSRDQELVAPEIAGTWAYVEVRGDHRWNPSRGERGSQLELWALFVDHSGVGAQTAARQLGLPPTLDDLGEGSCQRLGGPKSLPAVESSLDTTEASIELLDAGALYFRLPGQAYLVRPTLHPEVLPHISGVEYHKVVQAPPDGVSTQNVSVLGLGGHEVSTFELMHQAGPQEFRIRAVGGNAPGDEPLVLSAREPLRVRWAPAQAQYQAMVRLSWPRRGGRKGGTVICRPRSAGSMTLPVRWLRSALGGARSLEAQVQVVVSQRVQAKVPGAQRAVLVLAQSDAVSVSLEW